MAPSVAYKRTSMGKNLVNKLLIRKRHMFLLLITIGDLYSFYNQRFTLVSVGISGRVLADLMHERIAWVWQTSDAYPAPLDKRSALL